MKTRMFISVPVPNSAGLAPFIRDIGEIRGVRTSPPGQLHITLRFIGDIDDERTDEVADIVSKAVKGVRPGRITLKGTGAFPNVKRPRVIWTGIDTALPLEKIAERISEGLDSAGIPYDPKPFKPHITVARVRNNANVSTILRKYSDMEFATFICPSVKVMGSELTPNGAVHTILADCDLRRTISTFCSDALLNHPVCDDIPWSK